MARLVEKPVRKTSAAVIFKGTLLYSFCDSWLPRDAL